MQCLGSPLMSEHRCPSRPEKLKREAQLPRGTVSPLHCERRRIALPLVSLCVVFWDCCLFAAGDTMTEAAGALVSPVYLCSMQTPLGKVFSGKVEILEFPS